MVNRRNVRKARIISSFFGIIKELLAYTIAKGDDNMLFDLYTHYLENKGIKRSFIATLLNVDIEMACKDTPQNVAQALEHPIKEALECDFDELLQDLVLVQEFLYTL